MTVWLEPSIHPGEVLAEVYMKGSEPEVTVDDLADEIGVPVEELSELLVGKQQITPSLAARLAVRFRTATGYWIGLQDQYDRHAHAPLYFQIRRRLSG